MRRLIYKQLCEIECSCVWICVNLFLFNVCVRSYSINDIIRAYFLCFLLKENNDIDLWKKMKIYQAYVVSEGEFTCIEIPGKKQQK